MDIVRSVLSRDELLRFVESEHRTSRDSALREVQSRGLLADPEVASRALAVVRKMIGSGDPEEREIVESVARARELKATRDGQLFLLEALWRGVVQDTRVLRQGVATQLTYSPRDFLRAAEEIEKIEDDSLAKRTRGLISALLDESIAFWSREDLAEIQVLLKKGFGSVSSEHWILELVEPEDVPWVASSLGHFRTKFENAVRWLDQQSLGREAVSALARWVEDSAFRESLLTTTWSRSKGRSRIQVSAAEVLSRAIAAVAGAESDRVLERLVEVDSRHFFDPVTAAVVSSPVFHRDVCVRLLARAADWPQHAEDLLRRLAVEGVYVPEVVEAVRRDFNRPEYLRLVVVGEDSGDRSAYDGKAQAAILDAALSGKTPKNWEHVRREIVERKLLAERGSASDEVVEVLFNRALDHPDAKGRGLLVMHLLGFPSSYNELKLSLRERILAGGSPNLLRVAASGSPIDPRDLDWLKPLLTHPDSGVVRAAVRRFREVRGKEYVEWLAPCLKNPDPQVRSTATSIVYELGGENAVQRIVPLARDPDSEVRKTVCETLGRSLSPAAADVLIESLRDGEQRVSQAASKALSRIEKYFEHRRRWDRWKSEFSLEADSAAEALLRQAGGENPKKVRLAAIRSLGAVGVPETLPFLIRLMVDRNVDVSEAAAVAIEQIQRKLESAPPRPFGGLKE